LEIVTSGRFAINKYLFSHMHSKTTGNPRRKVNDVKKMIYYDNNVTEWHSADEAKITSSLSHACATSIDFARGGNNRIHLSGRGSRIE
jgi:hypothetical protein